MHRTAYVPPQASQDVIHVLLVEPDLRRAASALSMLDAAGDAVTFDSVHVTCADQAVQALGVARFDVILLASVLPDSSLDDGLEAMIGAGAGAPVVVLATTIDPAIGEACIRGGAQDCLSEPELTPLALARAIRYAIERVRNVEALRTLSLTDELTGLYNRRGLSVLGDQQLKLAHRSGRELVLATIDLDDLKVINDTFGHLEGDAALVDTAAILRTTFRSADLLARVGGDEFVAIAVDTASSVDGIVVDRLRARLREHNQQCHRGYTLSFTIGTARLENGRFTTLEQLIGEADRRLYSGKRARPGRVLAFPGILAPTPIAPIAPVTDLRA